MEIIKLAVGEINPAPHNPRKDLQPNDPEYKQIEESIDGFGLVEPVIWNRRTKNLVGGHQRFKILVKKGYKEIDVSVVDLDLEREKLLCIALNKVQGAWDGQKLASLLSELAQIPDLDIKTTGFSPVEISQVMDRYRPADEEADDFDFDGAVDSIVKPVTKLGDIVELGQHRIMCGDSANPDHIKLLMNGQKARLWYTDPPFNVAYTNTRPVGKKKPSKWRKIHKDDLPQEEYEKWFEQVIINVKDYIDPCCPVYIWNGHAQFGPMHLMLTKHDFQVGTVIVWAKERFALSFADYNQQVEFCLYSWKKGQGKHVWHGTTNESTLWQVSRDPAKELIHPTQKPLPLAQRAIKNSSERGDIVLETFLGSGSALIAAESLERRCFGMEIDPAYIDAICLRYINFVGKDKVSKEVLKKYFKEEKSNERK